MRAEKFCECVSKYRESLYIMALAILKNEADAEDAVSKAIVKGYENREQVKAFHKFKRWMLIITKNEALKLKKKRLYLPGGETVETLPKPVMAHCDELWEVLQDMKEEYRLVVALFYYEKLSLWEISDILDISVGAAKSRLNRGRSELKAALERE